MKPLFIPFLISVSILLSGCETTGEKPERGPNGTIAYFIEVESSEPGGRIEVNGEHVGTTPAKLKVFGDRDGTFHNFGTDDFVIKIYPSKPSQSIQTRVFRTGRWFSQEDKIPKRIYVDSNEKSEGFSVDLPTSKQTKP